jgi:hypothetical protein
MTLHDTPTGTRSEEVGTPDSAATPGPEQGPVRPPAKAFSMRMAMIVPGLGVLILGLFIGAEFLTANPVQQVITTSKSTAVAGTGLRAIPAVDALRPITITGEPPGNIINAVVIPKGAVEVSHQNNSEQSDQYDAQIELRADATQGTLNTFYKSVMKKNGWQLFDQGPAANNPGALEILGKEAGSDGFYWEMGAVISATSFANGAPATGDTDFTVRLFQVPDPD